MSRFLVRSALSAGICIFLVGDALAGEQGTTARPLPSAGQERILAALDQPTEFDFEDRPLRAAMDELARKHEIEILLDGRALRDAGVETSRSITEALKNIRLRSALRLLFLPLDLTYVVCDGYLLVTSKTRAESRLSFRAYPVHDLVMLDSGLRPARPRTNEVAGLPTADLGAGVGFTKANDEFSELIDLITSTVAPTSWDEVGGAGSIRGNPNTQAIAVSQADDVHEEIAELLAGLRRVRDVQVAASKPVEPASRPEASEKKPLELHAYRFVRGSRPLALAKNGWRPPLEFVGDVKPAREGEAKPKKPQAADPSGADRKLASWAETIAKLVPEMIEPESWEPSGAGAIRAAGEGVVVRNTAEVHRRVAKLMIELVPDCVPSDFIGPWGPWRAAFAKNQASVRLRPATTSDWPQRAEPGPSASEALLHEALLEKCDVEFNELPLIDALRPLVKPRQVQVFIDHKALTDAGVDTDTPITCSVKGLSYGAALKQLLDELDLTYLIRDEVLFITSKITADKMLVTKVYPVFDLVVGPPDAPATAPDLDFQSLIDDITINLAPTTWDEVGGPGAIREFDNSGALVISQTPETHEKIAEYLKALREVGAIQSGAGE